MNFYNDIDPKCCAWLRELIQAGHIPLGDVSETSITDLTPDELRPYTQVHLFCGIGGWPLALDLADWPRDRPVWTGSCPCQPFSNAGKRKGAADERHLWPHMHRLIRECRPVTVFGEQVASAIKPGWLDGVFADLEADGYACGAAVLGAHGVGAPHIRQRCFWVADAGHEQAWRSARSIETQGGRAHSQSTGCCDGGGVEHADYPRRSQHSGAKPVRAEQPPIERAGGVGWDRYNIIPSGDGKTRRIEPSISPLVDGVPARVVRLRGYGNAIMPQVAAEFVRAFLET